MKSFFPFTPASDTQLATSLAYFYQAKTKHDILGNVPAHNSVKGEAE